MGAKLWKAFKHQIFSEKYSESVEDLRADARGRERTV